MAKLEKGLFAITALFVQICSGWFWGAASILIVEVPLVDPGREKHDVFPAAYMDGNGRPGPLVGISTFERATVGAVAVVLFSDPVVFKE